LYNGSASYLKK